ncbi:hypothetical protein GCM10010404_37330 [Nonomuraea africana]
MAIANSKPESATHQSVADPLSAAMGRCWDPTCCFIGLRLRRAGEVSDGLCGIGGGLACIRGLSGMEGLSWTSDRVTPRATPPQRERGFASKGRSVR